MADTNYWTLLENYFSKEQVTEVIEKAKQTFSSTTNDEVYSDFVRWSMQELDTQIAKCQIKLRKFENDKQSNDFKMYSKMLKISESNKQSLESGNIFDGMFENFANYLQVPIKKDDAAHVRAVMKKSLMLVLCFLALFTSTVIAQSYSGAAGTEAPVLRNVQNLHQIWTHENPVQASIVAKAENEDKPEACFYIRVIENFDL